MSEFHPRIVRVGTIEKHPNADSLSMSDVEGYPVIFQTGTYQEGDLAAYIPIDAIVPADNERWAFLGEHRRIKARRLRGIFSMGLLTPVPGGTWAVGDDVTEVLRIVKWEPPADRSDHGENVRDPGAMPFYTDIEGWRKHKGELVDGEMVVLSEKLHGACSRFVYREDLGLVVGSRNCIKRRPGTDIWNAVADKIGLESILWSHPNIAIYGEVFGQVQDLKYGAGPGELMFRMFDAYVVYEQRYMNWDEFQLFAASTGLPTVPILYEGPWSAETLKGLSEGPSTLAAHVREGFVVKPVVERRSHMGRVILKMVGEGYLLRKGG